MKVEGEDGVWTSGFWTISEETARLLIDGQIFFHEHQGDKSYFGGTILDVERVTEGDYQGKIVFKFKFSAACRGMKTTKGGLSQEMKIVR